MPQSASASSAQGKEIPEMLRPVLISLGRGIGTVSVYGPSHPTVEQILDQTFADLKTALQNKRSISIGTFNGTLTVDESPVIARDVPVRTLEKRLAVLKISHMSLSNGLSRTELKQLLAALCSPTDTQMKETLSNAHMDHVEMSDVKYVALRDGEQKAGKGSGGREDTGTADSEPRVNVGQIVAFLKGEGTGDTAKDVKEMLSDPERLGQMIMEAASVRQMVSSVCDGESLADIIVGCLRRTYSGLRKETEFQSVQGKVNLTKAMMLLEKNVLDKIHAALGAQHPEIDRRIFDAIREMEEEQQFEMLTAHYFDQRRKLDRAENRLTDIIQQSGPEKASEMAAELDISPKDWQRLMVKAGVETPAGNGIGNGGLDMGALAIVLEKLDGLMSIETKEPEQIKEAVSETRDGFGNYTRRIESRIQELESQVELSRKSGRTTEDHADHLSREELMEEVSKLTLALLQPLTVINASVESALRHAEKEMQKDMLDLAYESGKRMQALTKRLMTLVGYPVINSR